MKKRLLAIILLVVVAVAQAQLSKEAREKATPSSRKITDAAMICTMVFISDPLGADVIILGKKMGVTPCTLKLKSGFYKAQMRKEGYQLYNFSYKLERGKDLVWDVPLRQIKKGNEKNDMVATPSYLGKKDSTRKIDSTYLHEKEKENILDRMIIKSPLESEIKEIPDKGAYVPIEKEPEIIRNAKVVFPEKAIAAGIQGKVYLTLLLDLDGKVMRAEVEKSSGSSLLDKAAVDACKQMLFTPALAPGGKPVRVWIMYPVNFSLRKE